ncbi:MAG TPA: hypothetical protein DEF79_13305 [Gammaproteobacteria bacterium]|nr:hypothetical protein [Gammaproteobacteria bacterium]
MNSFYKILLGKFASCVSGPFNAQNGSHWLSMLQELFTPVSNRWGDAIRIIFVHLLMALVIVALCSTDIER